MRLPGFTAEASLPTSGEQYRLATTAGNRTGVGSIVPAIWRRMWVCDVGGDCYWAWVRV